MSLAAGQSLSFYEILGPLGAGGMGEVYRAKDTRLDREVAIKVLPEHFAEDEERLRRFEREAKTLASPSCPEIEPPSCRCHDGRLGARRMGHASRDLPAADAPADRLRLGAQASG